MVRITSKKDGFMRCGIAHKNSPTDYPDKFFTKDQLQALQADPMLKVSSLPENRWSPLKRQSPIPSAS
jgi:hypothetical protein